MFYQVLLSPQVAEGLKILDLKRLRNTRKVSKPDRMTAQHPAYQSENCEDTSKKILKSRY